MVLSGSQPLPNSFSYRLPNLRTATGLWACNSRIRWKYNETMTSIDRRGKKGGFETWGPVPMVVQNARASGGKGVVLWVKGVAGFCRHLSEPRSARFGILTVQDVAKVWPNFGASIRLAFETFCGKPQGRNPLFLAWLNLVPLSIEGIGSATAWWPLRR